MSRHVTAYRFALLMIVAMGCSAALQATEPPAIDPRLVMDLSNNVPGTVKWISVNHLPAPLRSELLVARQESAGLSSIGRSSFFALPMDENVRYAFDRVKRQAVPPAEFDLKGTKLSVPKAMDAEPGIELVGYVREGSAVNGIWPRIGRYYKARDGTQYYLVEYDLKTAGIAVTSILENANAVVGSGRGTLIAFVDGGQKNPVWNLTWSMNDRYFELFVLGKALGEASAADITKFGAAFTP